MKRNNLAFVRVDNQGKVVPGSLVLRTTMPKNGRWIPSNADACCPITELITTTTSTTSTTTTSTTTIP